MTDRGPMNLQDLPDRGLPAALARAERLRVCAAALVEEATCAAYNALPEHVRLTTGPEDVREAATLAALATLELTVEYLTVDLGRGNPTFVLRQLWGYVDECRPTERGRATDLGGGPLEY